VAQAARVFEFGDFELDERLFELRHSGTPVVIAPRAFRLLQYLIDHRDRVVPKEELFAALWPDAVVSDATLSGALRDVREALGDDGAEQRWVQTKRKCGYRFLGGVRLRGLLCARSTAELEPAQAAVSFAGGCNAPALPSAGRPASPGPEACSWFPTREFVSRGGRSAEDRRSRGRTRGSCRLPGAP
jgi:DNA-binding winged helix-turn-helix (wHTH) protein